MEVKISIDFQKVNGIKYDDKNKDLLKSTEKVVLELCKTIEKYFKDHKIQVHSEYEMHYER